VKPAAPKKETAKIQLPPSPKPPMPKATIKLQATQPLQTAPAAKLTTAPVTTTTLSEDDQLANDPAMKALSIATLVLALVAVVISYLAYSAVTLPA
jgi:hypothetical protein